MNDLIEKLSNLRSQLNCFNENEAYHTLSEAIKALSERPEPREDATRGYTYKPDCPWYDGTKCNSPNDPTYNECDYDRGIFPESYNYDPRADIYYLAEKIGIHRLYALVVELRGEPEPCEDTVSRQAAIDALLKEVRLVDGYYVENDEVIDKDDAIEAIRLLSSVTPKRKTGKWIEEQRSIKVTLYKCSECGRAVIDDTGYDAAKDFPFCHCGADMRQREENK